MRKRCLTHREEHPCSVCRAELAQLSANVKARIGPAEAVALFGLEKGATRQGRDGRSVLCPSTSHNEDTASCSLTFGRDGTLRVKCFGCDLAGDLYDLAAAVEGLDRDDDFPKIVRDLAERIGLATDGGMRLPPPPPRAAAPPEVPPLADERFAAVVAPILHCGRLDAGGVARDVVAYLDGRGLLEAARLDGWAALPSIEFQPTWAATLFDAAEPARGYAPPFAVEDVKRCGLLRGRSFAHPENRLCVPFRDRAGNVVNVQRRRLDATKAKKYVFPDGRPLAVPYGLDRLDRVPVDVPIVYVEGATDVLALRLLLAARGEHALVLGVPGVQHWRTAWAEYARGRVAGVAVDTDTAGEKVVARIARDLADAGARRVERWAPPGKDWAEMMGGAA